MFKNFTKYEVYEDGRIWSYSHKKFLKPAIDNCGYQVVNLYDNEGNKKRYYLHRVIYESVTGNPIPEGMQINHISEDKTDNRFANLNLMTPKQNSNWGTRNERLSKQVGAYKDGKLVMTFPSTREAQRNGFNGGNVSACCRNCFNRAGNNVYKGYTWQYLN